MATITVSFNGSDIGHLAKAYSEALPPNIPNMSVFIPLVQRRLGSALHGFEITDIHPAGISVDDKKHVATSFSLKITYNPKVVMLNDGDIKNALKQ